MDKKVGIVTFHRALSYGANLQAYALQNFLFKLGIDNEIIDYRCQYMIDHYQKTFRKSNSNAVKRFVWNIKTAKSVKQKKIHTTNFVDKYLKLSKPYDSDNINSVNELYRAFITGSDQVWSPTCVGFDPVYFLTFADSEKKFSYAASIAVNSIPDKFKSEYKNRLCDFSGISLREQTGADIVSELTGKKTQVNIDPSMLLTVSDWDKICSDAPYKEPYILLFTVPKPKNLVNYALKLAQEKNCRILWLNSFGKKYNSDRIEYLSPVDITEFIGLIKNAEYVCTNSFHGNAFSLLYHKNFVVETDTAAKKNVRSEDLMLKLNLKARILSTDNAPDINDNTDWDYVDRTLDSFREESKKYLIEI